MEKGLLIICTEVSLHTSADSKGEQIFCCSFHATLWPLNCHFPQPVTMKPPFPFIASNDTTGTSFSISFTKVLGYLGNVFSSSKIPSNWQGEKKTTFSLSSSSLEGLKQMHAVVSLVFIPCSARRLFNHYAFHPKISCQ